MRILQAQVPKELADKLGIVIKDFSAKVAAVQSGQKDPANVAIASTAIRMWDKDNSKFNRANGQATDTPVKGLTTLKKDIVTTCNYFVADVLQRATDAKLGKTSWSGNVWPPVANAYANPGSDSRLKNFSISKTDELGNVIAFPHPGDSGHVGISLGSGIYVSARTGDVPGTTGKNPVQPFSGIQIKAIPDEGRPVSIRYNK